MGVLDELQPVNTNQNTSSGGGVLDLPARTDTAYQYARQGGLQRIAGKQRQVEADYKASRGWRAVAREIGPTLIKFGNIPFKKTESFGPGFVKSAREFPTMKKGPQDGKSAVERGAEKTWNVLGETGLQFMESQKADVEQLTNPNTTGGGKAASAIRLFALNPTMAVLGTIGAPFEGLSAVWGVGHVADVVNKTIAGAAGGTSEVGLDNLRNQPGITEQEYEELAPLVSDLYGITGAIVAGGGQAKATKATYLKAFDTYAKLNEWNRKNVGVDTLAENGIDLNSRAFHESITDTMREANADEATVRAYEEAYRQYLETKDSKPIGKRDVEADNLRDPREVIRDRVIGELDAEINIAEPGRQYMGDDGVYRAESSTYPDWLTGTDDVPAENVRTRSVLDAIQRYLDTGKEPRSNATNQIAAIKNLNDEIARRETQYLNEGTTIDVSNPAQVAVPPSRIGQQEGTPVAQPAPTIPTETATALPQPVGSGAPRVPTAAQRVVSAVQQYLQESHMDHPLYYKSNFSLQGQMVQRLMATDMPRAKRILEGKEPFPRAGEFGAEEILPTALHRGMLERAKMADDVEMLQFLASDKNVVTGYTSAAGQALGFLSGYGENNPVAIMRSISDERIARFEKKNKTTAEAAVKKEVSKMEQAMEAEFKKGGVERLKKFIDDIMC